MGEDVGAYGGCFAVTMGLLDEFGPTRVRDTPLSESTFVGAGIGAAMGGMRPIVEVMTCNFSLLALDQVVNNAATLLHMSGGQFPGDRGVESVYGIIYPPQVALVGAGRITPRPWPANGSVAVRRVVHLTLAADHRASDGHRGALFLDAIARRLQEPETL